MEHVEYLDPQDKTKLHAEVTQTVNQRFILAGAAVTISIALLAKFFKDPRSMSADDLRVAAWTSLFVSFLLFIINQQCRFLWRKLRTFTVYLRLTHSSKWEDDWYEFRAEADKKKGKLNHFMKFRFRIAYADRFSNRIVFSMLHAIWAILVIVNWCAIYLNGETAALTRLQVCLCTIPVVISVALACWSWFEQDLNEDDIEHCWRDVLSHLPGSKTRRKSPRIHDKSDGDGHPPPAIATTK
jgi:hypothetical protein